MTDTTPTPPAGSKTQLHIALDWRVISVALALAIVVMLYYWKPWAATSTRTISVEGTATVQATPDEYQFSPYFQDADVKKVTATGNEAVAALKKLGVKDADIKTSVQSSASGGPEPLEPNAGYPIRSGGSSTFSLTVTVHEQSLAQKVADYLATTTATGQVTPQATFSTAARSKLDIQARSAASKDALAKAKATAGNLGAHVGKVLKISDNSGGIIYPLEKGVAVPSATNSAGSSGPVVQPGTNDVTYTFTVEFELK